MFTCLLAPSFRLQAALRWRESRGSAAVVDEMSTKAVILEVNRVAEARRIFAGMTATQAMAHDPRILILPRAPEQESCLNQLLAERGLALSPEVELSSEGFCVINLHNVAAGTCWQQLADEQIAHLREQGVVVQVGMAGTPDLAILAAKTAITHAAIIYDAPAFVTPLPLLALEPGEALRAILQDWGIRTVGEFLALPGSEVTERLGAEAQALRRKVSGQHKRPLELLRTPPAYAEAYDFDYEVDTTEPLLFVLRRFLDSLCTRLRTVYRVAQTLHLTIPLDDRSLHSRVFCIPSPTAEIEVLFRILETYLETLQLRQRPVGVRLRIEPSPPTRDQLSLFESALRDPNLFGETLARLKALLGNNAVGVPMLRDTHRPDDFFLADTFPTPQPGPPSPCYGLPLRRYRPAEPGSVQTMNGQPATLESAVATGNIAQSMGPYRLSGHWWDKESWETEEWDVELAEGGLYRISRQDERWTVEGCYDVC